MKVLSLFDGISCGMVALERAGIPVERYVAYEIDEDAIKVSKFNYPQIEHKGDVFEAQYTEGEFDLLIGGSPCTYWSIARRSSEYNRDGVGRETVASGLGWDLFSQYVRALKEAKPKYFLYENNSSMSDEIKECISNELGCEPHEIDSADFSAQVRKRYYWTNIPLLPYEKSNLLFSDIADTDSEFLSRSIEQYSDTIKWSKDGLSVKWDTSGKGYYSQANRAKLPGQKWNTVCANRAESKGNVWLGNNRIRLVTISELEKLQTLPVGYTSCLKNKEKRGKGIGNGWTVDVIAHIFTYLKQEKEKEMELRIEQITFPEVIEFNFDELKQEITNRVAMYTNMVYTEDQVKQAKADRANLNKFVKALSDERIKVKKQCMKPYEEFESKVNELSKIVQEPIKMIDKQVKEYEEQKKRDKLDEITNFFNSTDHPEWLHISQIMNEKWLNISVSMKSILEEIDSKIEQIKNDLATLSNLPEFGFEATEVYKSTLDINKALNEGRRLAEIQKRKAEHEAEAKKQAEREVVKMPDGGVYVQDEDKHGFTYHEPQKQWVSFSALLSMEDAIALKDFFESRQIEFKPI